MLLNCSVEEDSWESLELQGDQTIQSQRKSILNIHWKDWCWSWNSNTLLWPPDAKNRLIGKDPDARKEWRREEKGTTGDEMVGWHHRHNGHEVWVGPRVGDGQGGLDERRPSVHGLTKIWTRLRDWIELMARAPPIEQISLLEFLPPYPVSTSYPQISL